ncbi:MAG: sulfite exporter TauE/SafE family protein [Pseudomonadota bacterium]
MTEVSDPWILAFVAAVFLAAGAIKGVVGIGLPTASVGMMSQVLDPRLAIALAVFPSLISNAWQILRTGQPLAAVRRFWVYLICLMGTIFLVSLTLTATIRTELLILALGCVILVFSVMSLAWQPPFLPARYDRAGQMVSGLTSGFMGGLTGIWAPAMVPYLMARRLDPDTFMRATGVMIFFGTIPLIAGYWQTGMITAATSLVGLIMVIPAVAGFALGERVRRHLDAEKFRKVVLWVFLAMGLNLIRRALL